MITLDLNHIWSDADTPTRQAIQELWSIVMDPMKHFYGQTLCGNRAQKALRTCFNIAESSFAAICARHSVEFWFPLIREQTEKSYIQNEETYATLSLLKYAGVDKKDSIPIDVAGSNTEIGLLVEPRDFLDVNRLTYLATLMGAIGNAYRRVGKGSELLPSENFPICDRASIAVESAMGCYDNRRPYPEFFRDQGMLHNINIKNQGIYFMGLAKGKGRRFIVPEWSASWPCHRLLAPFEADSWIQILESYREAIEDLYEIQLDSLFHFLSGLALNIMNSVPCFEGGRTGDIRLLPGNDKSEEQWKRDVQFLLSFTRKGYFRFPLDMWLNMMSWIRSPWAESEVVSRELTEEFFQNFCLNEDRRAKIEVSAMFPMPFCFRTSSNWIYVDVQHTEDFLVHLLHSGKDWFATQHGDRFTLALKRLIQTKRPEVDILGWKQKIPTGAKGSIECDLLLATKTALWVIECKAFGKSPEYYRGDHEAVRWRLSKLHNAFEQAQKQSVAIRQAITNGNYSLPKRDRVETVVCTPVQEFIYPVDAFGFITGNIPRICTPEELLEALTLVL